MKEFLKYGPEYEWAGLEPAGEKPDTYDTVFNIKTRYAFLGHKLGLTEDQTLNTSNNTIRQLKTQYLAEKMGIKIPFRLDDPVTEKIFEEIGREVGYGRYDDRDTQEVIKRLYIDRLYADERKNETEEFSQEVRNRLLKEGFVIYRLRQKSFEDLRREDFNFVPTWMPGNLRSRNSEVAINPEHLFIRWSNIRSFDEQIERVVEFSRVLQENVILYPGIKAVMGEAADYAELAFLHFKTTGERLFGEKYNNEVTRTKTPLDNVVTFENPPFKPRQEVYKTDDLYTVGPFNKEGYLSIMIWGFEDGFGSLKVAPLVVPTEK